MLEGLLMLLKAILINTTPADAGDFRFHRFFDDDDVFHFYEAEKDNLEKLCFLFACLVEHRFRMQLSLRQRFQFTLADKAMILLIFQNDGLHGF